MTSPVKRLTRGERQEQTRRALLDAAIELFIERGIDAISIEDIAARAGYTRGAFYSNFDGKDALFVAACARFLDELHAAARGDGDVADDPDIAMRTRVARLRRVVADGASVFLAEISLYAIRHPELIPAIAELHRRQLAPAIEFARANLVNAGVDDADDAFVEQLANIVQSMTFGLHLFGRIDADIGSDAASATALRLLLRGAAAERGKRRRR